VETAKMYSRNPICVRHQSGFHLDKDSRGGSRVLMAYMIYPFDYNHNSRLFSVLSNRYHKRSYNCLWKVITLQYWLTHRYCQPQAMHQHFCTDL